MIPEQSTAISLFDSGRLDEADHLPSVELRQLKKRPEFRQFGILQTYFYGVNITKPPTDDVRVRRAIAHAIDRRELTQMLAGGETPITGWVPPGMFGYDESVGLQFDVETAKSLLKEAGYGENHPMPKIEIKFNTNENHQRIAENIQAQLKRNLGIEVELKNEEWKVFLNTIKSDPPALFRFGWLADYPDPDNFLSVMAGYSDNNHSKWKNAKFDQLLVEGASETNPETRKKIYHEAQKILVEDEVPVIPLFASVNHLLVNPRVENYPISSIDRYEFKNVRLKP
jgi:oligopeptide transport system substrate-binding protein